MEFLKKYSPNYLADTIPIETVEISPELVIGNDYFWDLVDPVKIKLPSSLYLIGSKLGMLLGGNQYGEICDDTGAKQKPEDVYSVSASTLPRISSPKSAKPPDEPTDLTNFWKHQGKLRKKVETQMIELDEQLYKERQTKAELDELKRKLESGLPDNREQIKEKTTQLEEFHQQLARRDEELLSQALTKLDEVCTGWSVLNKELRKLVTQLQETQEDLEAEKQMKVKAERQKRDFAEELEVMKKKLGESAAARDRMERSKKKLQQVMEDVMRKLEKVQGSYREMEKRQRKSDQQFAE
ncbi:MAG: hypothetical protein GY696_33325, partial [Gammaproteobacteria bacterium]|nr:hypothetical protein [Gammaproteobacteria bacterium]